MKEKVLNSTLYLERKGGALSSMLICRFYRDAANSSDTYTGSADFYIEKDAAGSRTEYSK